MSNVKLTNFGSLPAVRIAAPDGAQAIVTLYGAHLVSWTGANAHEHIFCSARATLDGSRAIRGGIPLIFPQFAEHGQGLRHGFARVCNWRLDDSGIDDGAPFASFALEPDALPPALLAQWPHAFALRFRVLLGPDALELSFEVSNTDHASWSFCAALHSYFRVDQLERASIDGLQDLTYCDAGRTGVQMDARLRFYDKIDRMYRDLDAALVLNCGTHALQLTQSGFVDAVVWNPGAEDATALSDLEDTEFEHFVCAEAARLTPLTLAPGATWIGLHQIRRLR